MNIDIEQCLKVGAFIISFLLFTKGICEYSKAQKWKKAEFVAKEIKEFLSDFDIKRALTLLDWNSNELELRENEIEGKFKIYFTNDLLISSLKTHNESPTFNDEEIVIKGLFDNFFDKLGFFNNYIKTGLIKIDDIKPYLIYWIEIIANEENNRKPNKFRNRLWNYVREYKYNDVIELCEKFGFKQNSD